MPQRPGALRVDPMVEIGLGLVQQLVRPEMVEAQQPVRLIEPVLPQQRRLEIFRGGQQCAGGHGHIGGVEDPLELIAVIERLGEGEDLQVVLRRGADDHLGGLTRRGKARGVAEEGHLLPGGGDPVPDPGHGGQNVLPLFVRGQLGQTLGGGQLDVHAQPVGKKPQPVGEQRIRPRNGLGVDVAPEAVLLAQQPEDGDHPLRGVIRVCQHRRGQEQPLDIVAPVELDGQLRQLPGGEGGPGHVVGAAVDAVLTVIGAHIGHQHLQQRYAPAVGGEAVAAACRQGGAHPPGPGLPVQPAGGAGGVVLGGVGENRQLIHHIHDTAAPPLEIEHLLSL